MILLLGASSYVGQAFAVELRRRGRCFVPLTRKAYDYTQFGLLFDYIRRLKPAFVINASAETGCGGEGTVEECPDARFAGLLPQVIGRACSMTRTPWGHVSTGAVFSGFKGIAGLEGGVGAERECEELGGRGEVDLDRLIGFSEWDELNRGFGSADGSDTVASAVLAERSLRGVEQCYVWRFGLPFGERDEPGNFLTRVQQPGWSETFVSSMSEVGEAAGACLELWERRCGFGIYHVSHPGLIGHGELMGMIRRTMKPELGVTGCVGLDVCMAGESPGRSGAGFVMDNSKLEGLGIRLRPVRRAVEGALRRWVPAVSGPWAGAPVAPVVLTEGD